jgi:hypothetical protein
MQLKGMHVVVLYCAFRARNICEGWHRFFNANWYITCCYAGLRYVQRLIVVADAYGHTVISNDAPFMLLLCEVDNNQ